MAGFTWLQNNCTCWMKLDKFHVLVREPCSRHHGCSISSAGVCWCTGEICTTISTITIYDDTVNYWFKKSKAYLLHFYNFWEFSMWLSTLYGILFFLIHVYQSFNIQWTKTLAVCNVLFIIHFMYSATMWSVNLITW